MNESLYKFYSEPQTGTGFPVYAGSRKHLSGGGFLATLARNAIPILKTVGRKVLSGVSKGASSYLQKNQELLPAMTSGLASEIFKTKEPTRPKRLKKSINKNASKLKLFQKRR